MDEKKGLLSYLGLNYCVLKAEFLEALEFPYKSAKSSSIMESSS